MALTNIVSQTYRPIVFMDILQVNLVSRLRPSSWSWVFIQDRAKLFISSMIQHSFALFYYNRQQNSSFVTQGKHTHRFNGHFPGKPGLASCHLILNLYSFLSRACSQDRPKLFISMW